MLTFANRHPFNLRVNLLTKVLFKQSDHRLPTVDRRFFPLKSIFNHYILAVTEKLMSNGKGVR